MAVIGAMVVIGLFYYAIDEMRGSTDE